MGSQSENERMVANGETKMSKQRPREVDLRQGVGICTVGAFEGALYSLGMIWYRRSREDSPDVCKRRPEVW